MASRFTDTDLWNEDWFCDMPGEYQLFVKYVFDTCDNAGVWKPKKFDFETKTKFKVSLDLLFKKMNGGGQQRVLLLDNGRWFITGYILFQWFNKKKTFDLGLTNKLHKSLFDILLENNVDLKKVRGLKEVLETSMVMVVDKSGKGGPEEKDITLSASGFSALNLDKAMQLSDLEIGKTIEFIRLKIKKMLTFPEVRDHWEAFKIQHFGGKQWYSDFLDLITHFRNSLKAEILNQSGKSKNQDQFGPQSSGNTHLIQL